MPATTPDQITAFIARWENSGAAERANYQMFLSELCGIIGVPRPDPTSPDPTKNLYVFDRAITRTHLDGSTSTNYIDLYKGRHFVCETKQGLSADAAPEELAKPTATKTGHGKRGTLAFDKALERAYHQARGYITALPAEEGRPPFLIVCDVGHSIDLYAEFTGTGGQYERFPDPVSHRITLPDLHRPEIRARLRQVWLDPHSLDPSKVAAKVTRDIAGRLALLAKSLEADHHDPQVIAGFLQRSLFTMFAEDVGLLPEDGFKSLLARVKDSPRGFPVLISALWQEMATGTHYSALLFKEIAHFNGGLFETTTALPLSAVQLDMLADAAATDWSGVEPSIFGTLLVRALNPRERHKLGAEFTPRSYVERLIRPTIIGPLRDEWDAVRVAAATLHEEADQLEILADQQQTQGAAQLAAGASAQAKETGAEATRLRREAARKDAEALQQVIAFHRRLCKLRILDPACGTANFLYVTMEHMKRLEAEVLELITGLGGNAGMEMHGFRVRPEQFIGLEINQQAVAIAQLVLWIGYFQWQRKTTGKADTGDRPLLPKDQSIFAQDAVLAYDARTPRRDPTTGEILTVWNGHTTKPHPITGKDVPDESATIALFDYSNPRRAEWPQADYIVGNPPYIGVRRLRSTLGDEYVKALASAYPSVPETSDYVMYWWEKAALSVAARNTRRFGFITTNSIVQSYSRRVLERHLVDIGKVKLLFAVADHPWVDSADGAKVRVAMTVGCSITEECDPVLGEVECDSEDAPLTLKKVERIGTSLDAASVHEKIVLLGANGDMCFQGIVPSGNGFKITGDELAQLGFSSAALPPVIRRYIIGKDLVQRPEVRFIIDFFGLSDSQAMMEWPGLYQWLMNRVRPEREAKRGDTKDSQEYANNWWVFAKTRPMMRKALNGLSRFIVTPYTAKHRPFVFVEGSTMPDAMAYSIASDDPFILGVLSSLTHAAWALKMGGTLEDRPRYNSTSTFGPFPFPALEEGELKQRIRELGERLDAHRKRQQAQHPGLTLTGMYNVLEKLRAGEALSAKDRETHDQGLISLLKQLHDDLDAAVLEAYGWADLSRSVGVSPTVAAEDRGRDAHAPCLEQQLLTRLVALNHQRAAEEQRGLIRWLRPDYQAPTTSDFSQQGKSSHRPPLQSEIPLSADEGNSSTATPLHRNTETPAPWPDTMAEQVVAVRKLLPTIGPDPEAGSAELAERLAACFGRKNKKRSDQITGILATLKALGHIT